MKLSLACEGSLHPRSVVSSKSRCYLLHSIIVSITRFGCMRLSLVVHSAGNKLNNLDVVYTPWFNLRKTPSMDVGQVGFHNPKLVSLLPLLLFFF